MADKQPAKSKRQVKDPETFRERAVKAADASEKPRRRGAVKRAGGKVFRPIAAPFKRLGRLKPFRIIGRIILPRYIRDSWQELRLVTWPTWKQSRQLTFAVLVFAVVFGAAIALVDYGLDKVFKNLLLK